jgi:hypothetical protein
MIGSAMQLECEISLTDSGPCDLCTNLAQPAHIVTLRGVANIYCCQDCCVVHAKVKRKAVGSVGIDDKEKKRSA